MNVLTVLKRVLLGNCKTEVVTLDGHHVIKIQSYPGIISLLTLKVRPRVAYLGRNGRFAVNAGFLRHSRASYLEPISAVFENPENYTFDDEAVATKFLENFDAAYGLRERQITTLIRA